MVHLNKVQNRHVFMMSSQAFLSVVLFYSIFIPYTLEILDYIISDLCVGKK